MASSSQLISAAETAIQWDAWRPLAGCWSGAGIPVLPGLYRIRRDAREELDYVGQTGAGGMTLRRRLAMLAGVFGAEMRHRDPHTAGSALWALQREGGELKASVAPVEGPTPWRKVLEALAMSLHRQARGRSPAVNFGCMPAGYHMSSANNARLVREGRCFRGGLFEEPDLSHSPGIGPSGPLGEEHQGANWAGHAWSNWTPLTPSTRQDLPRGSGRYRIRAAGRQGWLYIGEGVVGARLATHLKKVVDAEDVQGRVFDVGPAPGCSWILARWLAHQRLELENDLNASHLVATGTILPAQFLG